MHSVVMDERQSGVFQIKNARSWRYSGPVVLLHVCAELVTMADCDWVVVAHGVEAHVRGGRAEALVVFKRACVQGGQ